MKTKYRNPQRSNPLQPVGSSSQYSVIGPGTSICTPDLARRVEPPPYRPPPLPTSPTLPLTQGLSSDSLSIENSPQVPPRRKNNSSIGGYEDVTPKKETRSVSGIYNNDEEVAISVKKRTEKFNRLASVEDELSPARTPRLVDKPKIEPVSGEIIFPYTY